MSLNKDFTKTNDCLWIGVVGCLTPSPHVTRLLNSRINEVTNHTLEKTQGLVVIHLPLVISLKLIHIPVTHQSCNPPPKHLSSELCMYVHPRPPERGKRAIVVVIGVRIVVRHRQYASMTSQ